MDIKKLLKKYAVVLLVYIVITNFLQPYGLQLYYTLAPDPGISKTTVFTIQSIMTGMTFLLNLIFVLFIISDTKNKKALDWIIIIITFFNPPTGLAIFLIWKIYLSINENTRHNPL